jgi:hypothetical protein
LYIVLIGLDMRASVYLVGVDVLLLDPAVQGSAGMSWGDCGDGTLGHLHSTQGARSEVVLPSSTLDFMSPFNNVFLLGGG